MRNLTMWWVRNCFNVLCLASILFIIGCVEPIVPEADQKTFVISDSMFSKISLSKVTVEPIRAQLNLIGKIGADENKLVDVFPLVGGNVVDVNYELGDYVEKGSVLAVIRSGEVADFERQLIDAESDLSVAEKNLRVSLDLFESKLASERDVLAAKNEVNKTKAELNRIKEIFHIYGIDKKSEYQIKSPISGFIIEKKINRDMQLRSDKSDNIFTIAQINDVWVNANVYETDIAKIKEKMKAEIKTISYPDSTFYGTVDKIYNILDPDTKTMKVKIKLHNNAFLLKPEMNATVNVKYFEGGEMTALPSKAVIFDKSKNYVLVYHDKNNITIREIDVYKQTGDLTYVSKGLNEGDTIISSNQLLIYDALNNQ